MKKLTDRRVYILYDGRASDAMGTDEASVLVACESDEEALSYRGEYGGMSCYSYDEDGSNLINERFEWNWFPGDPIKDQSSV